MDQRILLSTRLASNEPKITLARSRLLQSRMGL